VSIAERKQRLTSIFSNVAEIAAGRMEELAGKATLRDAGITAGIATDKLLALSSDPFSQANNHLHVHLEKVDLVGQWNKMLETLNLYNRRLRNKGYCHQNLAFWTGTGSHRSRRSSSRWLCAGRKARVKES